VAIVRKIKNLESKELGYGTNVTEPNQRLMNRDGSSNTRRKGLDVLETISFFHSLITMSWTRFNLLVLSSYLVVNTIFAGIYMWIGMDQLGGIIAKTTTDKFWEAFFFSAQSLTTVGYGRINPVGQAASAIASVESMFGLLGFALATGLLYGRFSRPMARILFSDQALIAPYRGGTGLMFRIANKRNGEFTEPEVSVSIAYVIEENGRQVRKFNSLNLELSRINILNTTWTIVHPIDENSPMTYWTAEDFARNQSEVLVFVKGYDETFAETLHARTSYRHYDIIYGAKFVSATEPGPDGSIVIALDKISDYSKVDLPAQYTAQKENI